MTKTESGFLNTAYVEEYPQESFLKKEGYVCTSMPMNWWTAQNFCRSYGKNIISLSSFGISSPDSGACYGYEFEGVEQCSASSDQWDELRKVFSGLGEDSYFVFMKGNGIKVHFVDPYETMISSNKVSTREEYVICK